MTTNSPTNANVTQALINVQTKLKPLEKRVTGHHGKYANLEVVMDVLKPLLADEALAVIQLPDSSNSGSCSIKTILRHAPTGEEISSVITVPMQRQNDPQAFGAAMTYARRYALMCMFSMVTEDDDAASASYTLEKLLRELSTATNMDELSTIKAKHQDSGYLSDRFWRVVYMSMHDKKYASLIAMSKQEAE